MLQRIEKRLKEIGFRTRCVFSPSQDDGAPEGVRTLMLIGHLGGEFWPAFQLGRRDEADPLDNWTRRVIGPLAQDADALALYPFEGPPWLPFQRWAMKAEGLSSSPIGPLIHPQFGPWHGYRAALGFADRLPIPDPPRPVDLCAACLDKPCLSACPANVFASGRYDVSACMGFLKGAAGAACLQGGCQARAGCKQGRRHAYSKEQAAFHTQAFLAFY